MPCLTRFSTLDADRLAADMQKKDQEIKKLTGKSENKRCTVKH